MMYLLFRALALMLMLFVNTGNAFAFDWKDLWQRPDQRAYQILQDGDSVTAAEIFDDPQWRGVSHYRAGEFEQAQEEFNSVEGDTALYNQGVTAVQQGEFDTAVEKFEHLLERSPDHLDGQHNLEIARELAKQQEQEQQQGDQSEQQEDSDQQSDSKDEQDQSNSEGEGQSQDAESGSEGEQSDSENSDEERGGELTAEPEDAAAENEAQSEEESQSGQQNQEQQGAEQQSQQQQSVSEQQEGDEEQENQSAAMTPSGPSESEQATEQWLRRIPDDPSQLLRNKIKLNHMIEHADVRDMQEPW